MSSTRAGFVCLLAFAGSAFGQSMPAYLEVTTVHVKPDRGKDFEDNVKKLVDVNRRLKGDRWLALSTEYGEGGTFMFSSARENMAAVESGMEAFRRALKEGMGSLGDKLMRDLSADSTSMKSEIRRRRWDLSVHPPADTAAMTDMVAHTRWIRTIRLDVKPGRGREYIDAWKQFQAELNEVTPPVTAIVSESATGTPTMYIGMYYKSMAQMDTENAAVQKAVASEAFRNLMKVSSDAIAMSNWEIHRIRPELSNPPDEFVAADPTFWKPQQVSVTSSKKTSGSADRK